MLADNDFYEFVRKEKIKIKRIMRRLNPNGEKYYRYLYTLAYLSNMKKTFRKWDIELNKV